MSTSALISRGFEKRELLVHGVQCRAVVVPWPSGPSEPGLPGGPGE